MTVATVSPHSEWWPTMTPAAYDCARGHVVTILDCMTDWYTGATLHCGRPVTMHARDARRIDREIDARTAAYHATLRAMGLPVGARTAYGPCSADCVHA